MDISLLTFHGFNYDGKTILAKQVEVEGREDSDSRPTRQRRSVAELREHLHNRIEIFDVSELFDDVKAVFRENWMESSERPGTHGLSIRLRNLAGAGRLVAYARIDPLNEGVRIVFYPRAVELCTDEFRKSTEEIPYKTYPQNRNVRDPNIEIQFSLTADEWETHKEKLTALTRAVYEAWQSSGSDE